MGMKGVVRRDECAVQEQMLHPARTVPGSLSRACQIFCGNLQASQYSLPTI